jgi:hypothetical protein
MQQGGPLNPSKSRGAALGRLQPEPGRVPTMGTAAPSGNTEGAKHGTTEEGREDYLA